jgi:hypothetical protein
MIEKILLRIAKRGPGLTQLEPGDTSVLPGTGLQADPLHFPRRGQQADTSDGLSTVVDILSRWESAKESHYRSDTPERRALALPSAYAGYGAVHARVGALIWSERTYIKKNIVHIVSRTGDVVAAIYPEKHTVAIRKALMNTPADMLSIRELPASAQPFEGDTASKFETSTLHMLLWYYGQVEPSALENIPQPLLRSRILLHRLPFLMPNALSPRHLHLIQLFSVGPLYLRDLFKLLKPDAVPLICADLTSFYLTGCLVAAEHQGQPA